MTKINATTQNFTEIKEIAGNVVLFSKGNACLVFELTATNFSLLSPQEQEAKIFAYAGLLNSLSFPIQIIVRSKKLDISNYLGLLDTEITRNPNNKLGVQIQKYRNFVAEMVKVNSVLDKKFYIIISYNHLENPGGHDFKDAATTNLHTKASTLLSQLGRLNLRAKILGEEELTKLFYEFYNEGRDINYVFQ